MKKFLPLLILLAGCTDPQDSHQPIVTNAHQDYTQIIVDNTKYDIFKLPDGTECVASYYKESITCNWKVAQ